MKKNKKTLFICNAAIIAALYVLLTFIASALGLSSGAVQLRFSEALCILPIFTPAAVPGLTIGCIAANALTSGAIIFDIIFGSLATLIGAYFTYILRNKNKLISFLPPVISNSVIVPMILKFAYGIDLPFIYMVFTVFAGEFISVYVFGGILFKALKNKIKFFI